MPDREPGEIVNPVTGELVTGCVTIGHVAEALGTTTATVTTLLETLGLVHRVLTWKDVPMICDPFLRKPKYYLTPEATHAAVQAGLILQIRGQWGAGRKGVCRSLILITPDGQKRIRGAFAQAAEKSAKASHGRRDSIAHFYRSGRTPSEIVELTGIPRRTVFRHLGDLRRAA